MATARCPWHKKRRPFIVGRGPSHATRACERVSLAMQRSRGTGPRATVKKTVPFIVGRGPVPRHAAIAGDRPPRYGKKTPPLHRRARACPSPCVWLAERITPVGQDRPILTRSGSGDPELQRWARCAAPSPSLFSRYSPSPQGGITTETEL